MGLGCWDTNSTAEQGSLYLTLSPSAGSSGPRWAWSTPRLWLHISSLFPSPLTHSFLVRHPGSAPLVFSAGKQDETVFVTACVSRSVTCWVLSAVALSHCLGWLMVYSSWQCPSLAGPAVPTAALSPCLVCECAPHLWDWSSSAVPLRIRGDWNILLSLGKIFAKLLMKRNFFIKNRVRNKTGLKPGKVSDKDVWLFSSEQQKQWGKLLLYLNKKEMFWQR